MREAFASYKAGRGASLPNLVKPKRPTLALRGQIHLSPREKKPDAASRKHGRRVLSGQQALRSERQDQDLNLKPSRALFKLAVSLHCIKTFSEPLGEGYACIASRTSANRMGIVVTRGGTLLEALKSAASIPRKLDAQ